MIVLDTSVVSELFKPQPNERVVAWLHARNNDVAITALTLAELLAGIERLPDGHRKSSLDERVRKAIRPYQDSAAILAFDATSAHHYAQVLRSREQAGRPISVIDAQTAAICRARGAVFATRNTDDFTFTGIDLVNPWQAKL